MSEELLKLNTPRRELKVLLYLLLPLLSVGFSTYVVFQLAKKMLSDDYTDFKYKGAYLSQRSTSEPLAPYLTFDHASVLRSGIKSLGPRVGQKQSPIIASSEERYQTFVWESEGRSLWTNVRRLIGGLSWMNGDPALEKGERIALHQHRTSPSPEEDGATKTSSSVQQVVPFVGTRNEHFYWYGRDATIAIRSNYVTREMTYLIGRRAHIKYANESSSQQMIVSGVDAGVITLTGEAIFGELPVCVNVEASPRRHRFGARIEKLNLVPLVEDGVGTGLGNVLILRLSEPEVLLPGDKIRVADKIVEVEHAFKGGGQVVLVKYKGDSIRAYRDSIGASVEVYPRSEDMDGWPELSIPSLNVTDELFLGGQTLETRIVAAVQGEETADAEVVTSDGTVLDVSSVDNGILNLRLKAFGRPSLMIQLPNFTKPFQLELNRSVQLPGGLRTEDLGRAATRSYSAPDFFVLNRADMAANNVVKSQIVEQKAHAQHQGAFPLWSTYSGLIQDHYDLINPSGYEYLIHALGPVSRRNYVEAFAASQPDFVQITARNFDMADFHGWTLQTSWEFYKVVLANYQPVEKVDYCQIWERDGIKWRDNSTSNEVFRSESLPCTIPALEGADRTSLILLEASIEYTVNNKFAWIPIIGKTPRLIIYVNGAVTSLPVSLPPSETKWTFPIIALPGRPISMDASVYSPLLPRPDVNITQVTIRRLDLDQERIEALFFPNAFVGQDLIKRFSLFQTWTDPVDR
jgi:hypothetical protein